MSEPASPSLAFPGQRPPFAPGNEYGFTAGHELSTHHGAYSERRVAPLAAEVEQVARADPSWPAYLDDSSYIPAVRAWASSEAVCVLLRRYLDGMDFIDALADTTTEESTETRGRGKTTRVATSRRVKAALELLDKAESRAASHRARLGLDPLSRARLGRDVTSARSDLVQILTAQREARERGDGQ